METILPKQHDDKQAETKGSTIGLEGIYEKPVLSPLGHMAQVTQKSGVEPDGVPGRTRS
jgi:hypothetical protein